MAAARSFLLSATWSIASVGLLIAATWTVPAVAAVRQCKAAVHAIGEDVASQTEARRKAMVKWIAEAAVFGQGFTRWQLADNRRVICKKTAAGKHICAVTGEPCTIQQAPGSPLPKPGTRRNPIET